MSARSVKSKKDELKKPLKKRKNIPERIVKKKPYFELVTAFLSIPVLITILLLNLSTLKNINATPTPTPEPVTGGNFYAAPIGHGVAVTPSSSLSSTACKKSLGPVSISSPGENDVVVDNPVTVNIQYDDSSYCGAAWSYRINGSSWSGYDNRSVALYNLPRGQVTFELRVRSIVTSEERTVTRRFTYNGNQQVFVPDNPNSSGSAN